MAKADGSFVERSAKERQKKNALERGVPLIISCGAVGQRWGRLERVLLQHEAVCSQCLHLQRSLSRAVVRYIRLVGVGLQGAAAACAKKQMSGSLCLVSHNCGVARTEKLMNRSKTKGAAPASGAAAQVNFSTITELPPARREIM